MYDFQNIILKFLCEVYVWCKIIILLMTLEIQPTLILVNFEKMYQIYIVGSVIGFFGGKNYVVLIDGSSWRSCAVNDFIS